MALIRTSKAFVKANVKPASCYAAPATPEGSLKAGWVKFISASYRVKHNRQAEMPKVPCYVQCKPSTRFQVIPASEQQASIRIGATTNTEQLFLKYSEVRSTIAPLAHNVYFVGISLLDYSLHSPGDRDQFYHNHGHQPAAVLANQGSRGEPVSRYELKI